MKNFTRIDTDDLQLGMRFSAPVFFDDGENMFLAEGKAIKPYHFAAINRWHIKSLLTYGHLISDDSSEFDDDFVYVLDGVNKIEEPEEIKTV